MILTCQNFIGLQEPSYDPAELIYLAKNTNSNGFFKTSWYGKEDNPEFLELEDSRKNTKNNFFPFQIGDIKTPENKLSTLHTATNSKSSQESAGKPMKKIKYFENFSLPFQSHNPDSKKSLLNEKYVNRKIINLDSFKKVSSNSNLISPNRETFLSSSKSKISSGTNSISNKNSERMSNRSKYSENVEKKEIDKKLHEYIQTLSAMKSPPHKTNFSIPEKGINKMATFKTHELEDTNCLIKDFIDVCNRKQSSMETSPRININVNNGKEGVVNLSTIEGNSIHNISILNNLERTRSQAIRENLSNPIIINNSDKILIKDNSEKKSSVSIQSKGKFTNNINIYLGNPKNEEVIFI